MGTDDLHKRRKAKNIKDLRRKRNRREPYDKILIVCEGSKTECIYFDLFRDHLKLATANVVIDPNSNSSPISVVAYAIELAKDSKDDPYDKVFCVIDRDEHQDFNEAIALIRKNHKISIPKIKNKTKIYGIVSDPCFEFWILLHFTFTTRRFGGGESSPCQDLINNELKKYIPHYSKSNKEIFQDLITNGNYKGAMESALRVYEHSKRSSSESPQTNVFVLIECLEKLKKENCVIEAPISQYYFVKTV